MADQIGKCKMINTLLLQNAFCVNAVEKEECQDNDFVDAKVQISETVITADMQDNLICKEMKQYDISTILENIKTEVPSSEVQYDIVHNNFKKEEGVSAHDIKIEFNNGLLYCEDCQVYCEDYCAKCGMLVHILNRTVAISVDDISREELPNNILEIRDYCGKFRIFALKNVPGGVKFGPFTGLNRTELPWKIKGGKFVITKDQSKYLNWMQYISLARNISEQNLLVFEYKHNLYYQSTRHIQEGEELLVYVGDDYEDSLKRNVEMDFIPAADHNFKDAFACTFCCLGFSSKLYLAKHKAICPRNVDGGFSIEELVQCPSCEIHLNRNEYFTHHMAYCYDRNDRKCILPTPDNRTAQVSGRKTRSRQLYECQQCKYRTKYKGDLKKHTNQHYKVKMYKCGICCRRYKTEETLRLHMENAHIGTVGKNDSQYSTGVRMNSHIKAEHSCSPNGTKQFKCSLFEFRTKHERSLKRHVPERGNHKTNRNSWLKNNIDRSHLKAFKYKCDTCDYKSNRKNHLKAHINAKHLKEFKYKCDKCDYKSNQKNHFKAHINAKHLKLFKYKCEKCDYKSNWKDALKAHIDVKHLKVFKYSCDKCDYKSNRKNSLKVHIDTKHLEEFKYKCDTCDYKSNRKNHFKAHIDAKHLNVFKYKCDKCDYKSYWKMSFKEHMDREHLKEFKYKCDTCDYKSNRKDHFKAHINAKHLKVFKYKCDKCDYKSSLKHNFKAHIEAKHLKVFKYKCDKCDYKAYLKSTLKRHIETRHLKEFKYKCDKCDYKANLKSNLKSHTDARHLKAIKYKCDTCDYKTNWKSYLKIHRETRHLKEFKYV